MGLHAFEGRLPEIAPSAYIAPSAIVIGDVRLGEQCYIGHGAILRGDYGTIRIGGGTAVEEGAILHARPGDCCRIGQQVTVGHGATIHNALVRDFAVVGIRAVLCDFSELGRWSILGEMALLTNSQAVPDEVVAVGAPARVVGNVRQEHVRRWEYGKRLYMDLARRYLEGGMQEIARGEALAPDDRRQDQ
jgi:carbonic anhydrase/acetyltransferase-like protein (isoleucine patch superfamily)